MKIYKFFLHLSALLTALIIKILKNIILIRLHGLESERIGHYIQESELYLCEKKRDKFNSIDFFFNNSKIYNTYIFQLLKGHLKFVNSTFGNYLKNYLVKLNFSKKNIHLSCSPKYFDRDLDNLLNKYKTNLKMPNSDIEKGYAFLKSIGINRNNKYICIGIRDDKYLKKISDKNYSRHDYRNCSVKNFESTIEYLLENNYHVIRVGRHTKENLNIKNKKFFDYSNSNQQSDFLDIFLPSKCFLFIGTSFGLDAIPQVFKRPLLSISVVPFSYISTFQKKTLIIFKKYFCLKKKKYLNIEEILQNNTGLINNTEGFNEKMIRVEENSDDEILSATKEMLNLLNNKKILYKSISKKQKKFWNIYKKLHKEKNIILHKKIYVKLPESFLRKNDWIV